MLVSQATDHWQGPLSRILRFQEQYEKSGVKNFFMPPAIVPGAKLGGPEPRSLKLAWSVLLV